MLAHMRLSPNNLGQIVYQSPLLYEETEYVIFNLYEFCSLHLYVRALPPVPRQKAGWVFFGKNSICPGTSSGSSRLSLCPGSVRPAIIEDIFLQVFKRGLSHCQHKTIYGVSMVLSALSKMDYFLSLLASYQTFHPLSACFIHRLARWKPFSGQQLLLSRASKAEGKLDASLSFPFLDGLMR